MWTLAIIFCLLLNKSSGEDDSMCSNSPYKICDRPTDDFPETELDLRSTCVVWKNFVNCLGIYDANCKNGIWTVFPVEGEFESIHDLVNDICDVTSTLHAAILENLKCLKENINDELHAFCFEHMVNISIAYDMPEDLKDEERADYFRKRKCMSEMSTTSCVSTYIGNKCGSATKNLLLGLMERAYLIRNSCPSGTLEDISKELDNLDLEADLKQDMKDVVQRFSWE